jgi:hypothetical protein
MRNGALEPDIMLSNVTGEEGFDVGPMYQL